MISRILGKHYFSTHWDEGKISIWAAAKNKRPQQTTHDTWPQGNQPPPEPEKINI
jgi:hypothetical protein